MSNSRSAKKANWMLLLRILVGGVAFVAVLHFISPILTKAHREDTLKRVRFLEIGRSIRSYIGSGRPKPIPLRLEDFVVAGVLSTQEIAFAERYKLKYFAPHSTSAVQEVILTMPMGGAEYRFRLDGTYENLTEGK
ncbi:exported hypothetical protein [Verrucomicrobia bacterium]|nr:exported hypothetical protein [Verrucomicrobiota bacterium]